MVYPWTSSLGKKIKIKNLPGDGGWRTAEKTSNIPALVFVWVFARSCNTWRAGKHDWPAFKEFGHSSSVSNTFQGCSLTFNARTFTTIYLDVLTPSFRHHLLCNWTQEAMNQTKKKKTLHWYSPHTQTNPIRQTWKMHRNLRGNSKHLSFCTMWFLGLLMLYFF